MRYGIVGAGMMGVEHIENILALDRCEVAAVSDPDEHSRQVGLDAAPGAVAYADHSDMLERSDLDVVVVASPNHTHADVLGDLLGVDNLHLLVEKPLCTTVEDCDRVLDQAEGRSGLVWMGLEYRYMPPVARLIDEVASGSAGNVKMVSIREHRFPFLTKVGNWNRFSRNTGGTLVEKCCHFFDLMCLLVDANPIRVMASGSQDVNHLDEIYDGDVPDIIDNAFVIVDFDGGQRAMLDLCMFAEATRNQEEISVAGDKAKLEALVPDDVVRIGRRGEHWIGSVEEHHISDKSIAHEGLHHGASFVEHRKFADCIRSGSAPEVSLADGRLSVAIGAAAHLSIDEGRIVDLGEIL
ncbi:MAG: Gfo/Idh/MocA family oxidoreductase [Actinomycetia bacterium]|nr:Gfo/Idh/MocA family oxidoreductase [Actinomycetes bacterium]